MNSQDIANDYYYERLFETEEDYDVIIYAGGEDRNGEIHAHSFVLRARIIRFIYCGRTNLEELQGNI
ncbi:unnamed protein product [Rhizophagus irregularis]|uniref:BTB domain-containing protein n=1 Tax=Rhizophagus irregularis TaxID=588596 RepID=A0A916EER9_9GLOM|nr:unnamed protein product [Rhizophagus irregularis]